MISSSKKLLAAAFACVAIAGLAVAPALAGPPGGTVPARMAGFQSLPPPFHGGDEHHRFDRPHARFRHGHWPVYGYVLGPYDGYRDRSAEDTVRSAPVSEPPAARQVFFAPQRSEPAAGVPNYQDYNAVARIAQPPQIIDLRACRAARRGWPGRYCLPHDISQGSARVFVRY